MTLSLCPGRGHHSLTLALSHKAWPHGEPWGVLSITATSPREAPLEVPTMEHTGHRVRSQGEVTEGQGGCRSWVTSRAQGRGGTDQCGREDTGLGSWGGMRLPVQRGVGLGRLSHALGPVPVTPAAPFPYSFLFTLILESFSCCSQCQQNKDACQQNRDAKRPADPPGPPATPSHTLL